MKKIPRIAILIETQFYYGRGILRGIAKYSRIYGPWAMFIVENHVKNKLREIQNLNVDAVIMNDQDENLKLRSLGIPLLILSGFYTPEYHHPYIVIDNDQHQLGRIAADHLLKLGCQNFAYCGYYSCRDLYWSKNLCESFFKRLNENGFKTYIFSPTGLKSNPAWSKEQTLIADWLSSLPKPVGVFGCNDIRCRDIIEACKIAKFRVPEDVAILGVGNDDLICDFTVPPLSSISLNIEEAGYQAAAVLDKVLNGNKMNGQKITMMPQYVMSRQSTDILAVNDKELETAVRFIQQNSNRPIQVDEVAATTALSRRVLEVRFRNHLNTSILEQIHHYRAELISKMLIETEMSISQIADSLGYDTPANFSRFFQKHKKMTPRAFRQKFKNTQS